jgi:BRCA1-associated protein
MNSDIYSLIIAVHPDNEHPDQPGQDWRLGDITVDWIDFTRDKSAAHSERSASPSTSSSPPSPINTRPIPGAMPSNTSSPAKPLSSASTPSRPLPSNASTPSKPRTKPRRKRESRPTSEIPESPDALSLQPLLAHIPGPNPVAASTSAGVTHVGNGVVHLFRHAPPASLVARLEGQNGESSQRPEGYAGEHAEGEDGSLVAILAVPAWMRPADLLEFLGGWVTCLEGVRMIREATTPNRSIVLLKFREPSQASDFMVIFTGRAFSTLDSRETCHTIRVHHLVLHRLEDKRSDVAIPAFPPSVYASRAAALPELLSGVPKERRVELPSCPVCLERLDSSVTGLVTLPCAHTFDCDCLRKWGDSRCPVCRVSHLLLASAQKQLAGPGPRGGGENVELARCGMCDSTDDSWICVVCGSVGCGRYSKGHARRHWKDTGHQLAMELETQRVWDYRGDNYVHRLIQSRMDGKLVELPSASSLAAMAHQDPGRPHRRLPLNRPLDEESPRSQSSEGHARNSSQQGPSEGDAEKMSTIESITLEYSYLLSSQLEAMRQHYESEAATTRARLDELEAAAARTKAAEDAREAAEKARLDAEAAREKAERRAEKALELSRSLQTNLGSERSMSTGLQSRITKLQKDLEGVRAARDAKAAEVESLNETVRDLMFSLEAGLKIQEGGGAGGEGGDLVVQGGKKKKKK